MSGEAEQCSVGRLVPPWGPRLPECCTQRLTNVRFASLMGTETLFPVLFEHRYCSLESFWVIVPLPRWSHHTHALMGTSLSTQVGTSAVLVASSLVQLSSAVLCPVTSSPRFPRSLSILSQFGESAGQPPGAPCLHPGLETQGSCRGRCVTHLTGLLILRDRGSWL